MQTDSTITVTADQAGERLDKFLAAILSDLSRTTIQRLIENGDVLVNERLEKPSYRTRPDDAIDVEIPPPIPTELTPEPMPLDIVFEDSEIVVVNKPSGLVVHPGAGIRTGTLANGLVAHFNELSSQAGSVRPGIVHRIDKDTSGLLVVAKTDRAHQSLADQFSARAVYKKYQALCYGQITLAKGTIDAPIGRDPKHRTQMAVRPVGRGGRPALSMYRVSERFDEFTLLDVEIKTGRTHQIRVHLASIRHPVVGDKVYSAGRVQQVNNVERRRAAAGLERQFLHAAELGFTHPLTGEAVRFLAPLPAALLEVLAKLRLHGLQDRTGASR